jgi:small subunit ribosomal protein S20
MAITKSAKKAIRQSLRRKNKNLLYKNNIKNLSKEVLSFVSKKNTEEAKKILPKLFKALDKAVKVNVFKKNTASRQKSRFAKMIDKK